MTQPRSRCVVIAEAGVNHNGQLSVARGMVDVAAAASADAVKFQTFGASRIASARAPKARYQRQTGGDRESQVAMLQRFELTKAAHVELSGLCHELGIEFLSTPFDEASVDLLEEVGVRRYKIASGEATNAPLLAYVGKMRKPVILSTGMCTLSEVEHAVRTLDDAGAHEITLLHCTSSYPADPAEANLRAMESLRLAFGLPVGYSDHTLGTEVACAAVALGATVIEKHFTLARSLPGPDQQTSMEPGELTAFVAAIRRVEAALGDGFKRLMPGEADTRLAARRSLTVARDLGAGTVIRREDLAVKRPGNGISPTELDRVVGRRLAVSVDADHTLTWEDLD